MQDKWIRCGKAVKSLLNNRPEETSEFDNLNQGKCVQPIEMTFRFATKDDLPAIISLLADDVLGVARESLDIGTHIKYERAFSAICAQTGNQILLGIRDNEIAAMLQLTFIPSLSHQGGTRAQIESVRVKGNLRGYGIGKLLFQRAIDISKQAGCVVIQLTTDQRRNDALRFYEKLGFQHTHRGMKLAI